MNLPTSGHTISRADAVTLIGGGALDPVDLKESLAVAPTLVAADGGANRAVELGAMPDAVFGDFDSISTATRSAIPRERLHNIAEQDSTDFEKCLRAIDAPLIQAVGFTGDRIDHELSVYSTLVSYPERKCIVIGQDDICTLAPAEIILPLEVGARVSLFPMAEVTGRSRGLKWPIDGIDFAPWGRIGTSNMASADRVALSFDRPGMLLILPKRFLAVLRATLLGEAD